MKPLGRWVLAAAALFSAAAQGSELEAVAQKVKPTVALLVVFDALGDAQSIGSGFFVSSDGKLVTNRHVIEDAVVAGAMTEDGKIYPIKGLLALDSEQDLALVQVDVTDRPFLTLRSSTDVAAGMAVGVYGAPGGLEWTLAHGTISATDVAPYVRNITGFHNLDRALQISGTFMGPGVSGGPVFDMKGEVLGVVYGGPEDAPGVALVVPSEAVKALLANAAEVPVPFEQDRAARLMTDRVRNLAISLTLAALVGGYYGGRALRRRRLQKKLAQMEQQLRGLN